MVRYYAILSDISKSSARPSLATSPLARRAHWRGDGAQPAINRQTGV